MEEPQQSRIAAQALVAAAAELARRRHTAQTDKAGVDYFSGHLSAVAGMGGDWREKTLGYLHDVAEDTGLPEEETLAWLRRRIAPFTLGADEWRELAENLPLLNSRGVAGADKNARRAAYIGRFRGHPLAIRVKLHDLTHNMDLGRLPRTPAPADLERLERYRREYALLQSWLDA